MKRMIGNNQNAVLELTEIMEKCDLDRNPHLGIHYNNYDNHDIAVTLEFCINLIWLPCRVICHQRYRLRCHYSWWYTKAHRSIFSWGIRNSLQLLITCHWSLSVSHVLSTILKPVHSGRASLIPWLLMRQPCNRIYGLNYALYSSWTDFSYLRLLNAAKLYWVQIWGSWNDSAR